jgi:hypothetical protein
MEYETRFETTETASPLEIDNSIVLFPLPGSCAGAAPVAFFIDLEE